MREKLGANSGIISLSILLLIVAGMLSGISRSQLSNRKLTYQSTAAKTPIYLPEADKVKLITLGFDNLAARVIWFSALNYFGREFQGEQDYRWLSHMCRLVTNLDPKAGHVFEFCASMLAWVAKQPEESNQILALAMHEHPHAWRYPYLQAFNYWYFLENNKLAADKLQHAAKLPNAPKFLASLASRLMTDTQGPETAVAFLTDLIKNAEDENAREALKDKLKHAQLTLDISRLKKALEIYTQRYQATPTTIDQIITAGIIKTLPQDPFGGAYYIDANTNEITTSSGEKVLVFRGKTAKTGALAQEFKE